MDCATRLTRACAGVKAATCQRLVWWSGFVALSSVLFPKYGDGFAADYRSPGIWNGSSNLLCR